MKKIFLILLISLSILSCSKPDADHTNEIRFELNGRQYEYSNVIFSQQPFCGKIWYAIEGIADSSNIFLISIVTDSLHTGVYNEAGLNLWTHSLSGISTDLKINITGTENALTANFYGTLTSLGKSYSITNGSIFINKN